MATLVIKNLPDDLHAALKKQAADNRRSLTKEAVVLLENGVKGPSNRSRALPAPVTLKSGPIQPEYVEDAIREGRE